MEGYHKLEFENLKDFIIGGTADFIVKEKGADTHINFLVRKNRNITSLSSMYLVKYKSIQWEFIGTLIVDQLPPVKEPLRFYRPKEVKNQDIEDKYKLFYNLLIFIFNKKKLPDNIEILYAGRCCKCGRKLTNPKYIVIGIGPDCLKNE